MIKFKKIDPGIIKLIEQLPRVFESEGKICLAYLFGSLAINKVNELSDVDIAYLLAENERMAFNQEMELADRIVKTLKTDEVDLIQLNKAPAFFSYKVISGGRVIFCRDKKEREGFESKIFMRYLDIKPIRDIYFNQMLQHIKENR